MTRYLISGCARVPPPGEPQPVPCSQALVQWRVRRRRQQKLLL